MHPADSGYSELLLDLSADVRAAQMSAAQSVNCSVIELFWNIGRAIVQREEFEMPENGLVEPVSRDLRAAFPGSVAFAPENIERMRRFFLAYTRDYLEAERPVPQIDGIRLPPVLTHLPWRHNTVLIEKVQDPAARIWYAQTAIEFGWSLELLEHHVDTDLFKRQGKVPTPVERNVPIPCSDLARQILTDPFNGEFLRLDFQKPLRSPEDRVLRSLRRYLLSLEGRFALLGSPFMLSIAGEEVRLDQLFYHTKLRRRLVVALDRGQQPPVEEQLQSALDLVDRNANQPGDHPAIGLIVSPRDSGVRVSYVAGSVDGRTDVSPPKTVMSGFPSVTELEAALRMTAVT
jgi:predicted nuclease of restriction endonuclease-like (RecB) superfamily